MTKAPSIILLTAILLTATLALGGACGNHPLDTSTPSGSAGTTVTGVAGATGLAGIGASTGAAGADEMTGAAGTTSTGAAGSGPTSLPISANEALNRLANLLWEAAPDASVLAVGAQIQTTADLASVVQKMLADQRAAVGVGAFYRQWLDLPAVATLTKDPTLFPDFTPALQADMANETETFGVNVTLALNGTYQMLLMAPFSFINTRLANVYGVQGPADDSFQQIALPAVQRAGLLTQPALQSLGSFATRTSPTHRGAYIAARFWCQTIPAAPPGVPPLDPIPQGETVRVAVAAEMANAGCQACHHFYDPLGFAFEGFDAIGSARASDNGAPVDVSNLNILIPSPPTQTPYTTTQTVVDGPIELAALIANNATAEDCMTRQWLAFALGRALQDSDEPWVAEIDSTFAASGFNLKTLITAVLTSGPFLAP
jgi:hypothetical protein